jgi:beta-N-acetylhexosaminidase
VLLPIGIIKHLERLAYPAVFALLVLGCGLRPDAATAENPSKAQKVGSKQHKAWKDEAARLVAALDDRRLAAQLIMSAVDGTDRVGRSSRDLLADIPVGAVMLFKYNFIGDPAAAVRLTSDCIGLISASAAVPPWIALDHEGGSVHRLGTMATRLPAAETFYRVLSGGAAQRPGSKEDGGKPDPSRSRDQVLRDVETSAYLSGKELRALGINLNLAPVAEILDDQNRVFLGDRTYGADGAFVAAAAAAFVRGMDRAGVAATLKHFPGNAAADPHKAQAILPQDRKALRAATAPFALAMDQAFPAAVMVSHAVVAAVDPEKPASLSGPVLQGWLKKDLGYDGIVLADDFIMGAVAAAGRSPAQAAVESIAAGADMVMAWPRDLRTIHEALRAAFKDGSLSRPRAEDAARRIVYQKLRFGLWPGTGSGGVGDKAQERVYSGEDFPSLRAATEKYLIERGLR